MMNPIRNFKSMIFILQYIFDISLFGVGIVMNITIFFFHCYSSKKGLKKKLKQLINKKLIIKYVKYKISKNMIIKFFRGK